MQSNIGVEPRTNQGEVWLIGAVVALFATSASAFLSYLFTLLFVFMPGKRFGAMSTSMFFDNVWRGLWLPALVALLVAVVTAAVGAALWTSGHDYSWKQVGARALILLIPAAFVVAFLTQVAVVVWGHLRGETFIF